MMMGELTGNNVPIGDLYRHLGIVLDGQLITAPRIQAAIYGGGIINGNFTQAETDALAAKMLAGMMPGPLRLVSKREIAEKTH
jgi:SecD/SecF fusion protein